MARKYEDLADQKKVLADIHLEILQMEKENTIKKLRQEEVAFQRKQETDEELFKLQRESLLLDIKIKKIQLKKLEELD